LHGSERFATIGSHKQHVNKQGQLNFAGGEEGYVRWLTGRRMAARELAHKIHLPLGHLVEVWLVGGVRLRGELRLKEELLFIAEGNVRHLELMVQGVVFTYREMESCVRLLSQTQYNSKGGYAGDNALTSG
jgi:hypothetical protein